MNIKDALGGLLFTAGLALLLGVGVLAWRIGDTWSEATTAALVTGLVAVCGGGAVVVAMLMALIVGVPMAIRFFAEQGIARQAWGNGRASTLPSPTRTWREPQPPAIEAKNSGGTWQVANAAQYDLWEDDTDENW